MLIVFEDERLVAVSKPVDRVVIPGRGEVGLPLHAEAERLLGRRLFVVHRLDREASGLVVFAKDADAHRALCAGFRGRSMHKTYLALADGLIEADGEVRTPLREFGSGRVAADPRGKPSLTRYKIREKFSKATLLEAFPVTGRRHQVRAHLFSIGHPVLGDTRYGKERPVGGAPATGLNAAGTARAENDMRAAPRLMLHGLELSFKGPGGKVILLRAEPPPDFVKVLEGFRGRTP